MTRSVWLLCALTMLAPVNVHAEAAWERGVDVQLTLAEREILLAPGVDPAEFAASNRLGAVSVFSLGDGGAVLRTTLPEAQWKDAAFCREPGVLGCTNASCQTTQLAGHIDTPGARPNDTVSVSLLRDRPGIAALFDAAAAGHGYCTTPLATPPIQSNLTLTDNHFTLAAEQLPDDADCWTLAVEAACVVVTTPLSALVPAREPDRVVVLLAASGRGSAAIAAAHGLQVVKEVSLAAVQRRLVVFGLQPQQTVELLVAALLSDPAVESVQPDYIYRTSADSGDPYAFLAYGPSKIGAVRLRPISTGRGQHVVVIDTGVDLEHPELADRILAHRDFTGLGWSADLHGTAVAGIIAARADNGEGSYGVAPDTALIVFKACAPREPGGLLARCWTSTLVQALDAALAQDARIINLSLGGPPDPLVARYAALALANGRLLVAAAGNGGPAAKPTYPAALSEVLAVTAVDARDQGYSGATIGDFIDVSAPGVDIISPSPARTYPVLSGTSMAAAHVSGAAALLLELVPTASVEALRAALVQRSLDLGPAGTDSRFGAGEIDTCAAVQQLTEGARGCAP